MLSDRINEYERVKGTSQKIKYPTPAQYKVEFPFLKEVDSLALANTQLHLERAYASFFRDKKFGFPKWKSRKNPVKSYTTNYVNGNISLTGNHLKLPKLGMIRIKSHRSIPDSYVLKSVTVSQSASGKYYASILCEYDESIVEVEIESVVGLDFSMAELYISSEGEKPQYPGFYRRAQKKLGHMQRVLYKMEQGSKN
jgi:putative transposase